MFVHNPLESATSEIRLVRLKHGDHVSDPAASLEIEIQHVALNQNIPFAAISYVWGDVGDAVAIQVNGAPLRISRNLHDGLKELRAQGVQSWLWADQICICQTDLEEKQHQVGMMGKIFGNAELVYAWLGPGSQSIQQAMDWITRVGSKAPSLSPQTIKSGGSPHDRFDAVQNHYTALRSHTPKPDVVTAAFEVACFLVDVITDMHLITPDITNGLQDILQRDYWHRIWVVQEVALARNIVIMCGANGVSIDNFDRTCCAILYCKHHGLFHDIDREEEFKWMIPGNAYNIKPLDVRRQRCSSQMIHISDIIMVTGSAPSRPVYSATDPRDLAFALVGVLSDQSRKLISVDYNSTMEQVFTMLTKAMFQESSTEFGLEWCAPREDDLTMPSWVPDWRSVGRNGFGVYPINYSRIFNATTDMQVATLSCPSPSIDAPFLHFDGHYVGVITDVMSLPESSQPGGWDRDVYAEACLECVRKFTGLGTESGPSEDYIWRTILREYGELQWEFTQSVKVMSDDVLKLIRQLFRREPVDHESLSKDQLHFIRTGLIHPRTMSDMEDTKDQVQAVQREWNPSWSTINRWRTLFKTNNMMLGLGHDTVKVGDVVTLLRGNKTPVILRRRDPDNDYTYLGDAYVDGIMHGEFLRTAPVLETFKIF
ncbi:hypothetical protein E8E14_013286 [Neopestalotiopsis sp. 37M]|nr:hypothetical protein E8E14_013286 [Neopestalotiopsis sp. 37M]